MNKNEEALKDFNDDVENKPQEQPTGGKAAMWQRLEDIKNGVKPTEQEK